MEACKSTLSKQIYYDNVLVTNSELQKLEITAAAWGAFRGQAMPEGLLLKTWLHFQETAYESRVKTSMKLSSKPLHC